jgi:Ca2+-binding RTX toxin-like protein
VDGPFVDFLERVENLVGSAFPDIVEGDRRRTRIEGEAGDDDLSGEAGDDHLVGGDGTDTGDGGGGIDICDTETQTHCE